MKYIPSEECRLIKEGTYIAVYCPNDKYYAIWHKHTKETYKEIKRYQIIDTTPFHGLKYITTMTSSYPLLVINTKMDFVYQLDEEEILNLVMETI